MNFLETLASRIYFKIAVDCQFLCSLKHRKENYFFTLSHDHSLKNVQLCVTDDDITIYKIGFVNTKKHLRLLPAPTYCRYTRPQTPDIDGSLAGCHFKNTYQQSSTILIIRIRYQYAFLTCRFLPSHLQPKICSISHKHANIPPFGSSVTVPIHRRLQGRQKPTAFQQRT